jgi:outer membrane protein assembly factor BamD
MRTLHALGAAAVAALGLALAPACSKEKPAETPGTLEYTENARIAYQLALQAYLDRDWEEAAELFKDVKRRYSQSRYGRLAELRLADIAFEQEKLAEAIGSYKGYIQAHRTDPDIGYAYFRVCKALFLQISDTILLPPQEERDQTTTHEAYTELRKFGKEFPRSKWSAEVSYMLQSVTGRLARHELYVARFYLRKDNFEAAVARLQYALRTYEDSGLEPEAMVMLGETYLKMKRNPEARATFGRLLATHPESPFAVPARSFLNEMDATRR